MFGQKYFETNYYIEIAESVKNYIESNIEKDIRPEDAAKAANYSLKQLNRIFSFAIGSTLGEYIRWRKLTQALFELKYSELPIIDLAFKYGYESQEAFTRAFKDAFSVNPGDYRKANREVVGKNDHIRKIIHDKEHEYYYRKGIYKQEKVESWIISKPERIWASLRRNTENLPMDDFYEACYCGGLMKKAAEIPEAIITGGAYLPTEIYNREKWQSYLEAKMYGGKSNSYRWFRKWELSFGVELEEMTISENYFLDVLEDIEIFHIPQAQYVVFHCSAYSEGKKDNAIDSAWNAQKDYDVTSKGLKWAFDSIPYFESVDEENAYTLWFPVTENVSNYQK
jgi:AraC-like DNA-binding protein